MIGDVRVCCPQLKHIQFIVSHQIFTFKKLVVFSDPQSEILETNQKMTLIT